MAPFLLALSCGLDLNLSEDSKPKRPSSSPEEIPPQQKESDSSSKLTPIRQLRRISIELTGQLPKPYVVDKIKEKPQFLDIWMEHLLENKFAHYVYTDYFSQIWSIDRTRLFDLEKIARLDQNLKDKLTPNFVNWIKNEPIQTIRRIVEQNQPFSDIFGLNYSIAHKDVISSWSDLSKKTPEIDPYVLFTYDDGRSNSSGILASNGFLSLLPTFGDTSGQKRAYKLLKIAFCDSMDSAKAHNFFELTEQELKSDLAVLSTEKPNCKGCHSTINDVSPYFIGIADGKDWQDWSKFNKERHDEAFLSAKKYKNLDDLSLSLKNHPRFMRCQIERITSLILQMPYHSILKQSTALGLDSLEVERQNLRRSLRWLLRTDYYDLAPTKTKSEATLPTSTPADSKSTTAPSATTGTNPNSTSSDKATNKQVATDTKTSSNDPKSTPSTLNQLPPVESSGLRVLRQSQWQSILTQLSPLAQSLEFPSDLNPGFQQDFDFSDGHFLPQYPYWSAIESVVIQFSESVVDLELGTEQNPAAQKSYERYVFKLLPDDITTSKNSDITNQIKDIWFNLTTETLDDKSQFLLELFQFWNSALTESGKDQNSPDSMRLAWKSTLIFMLTHPLFFTY